MATVGTKISSSVGVNQIRDSEGTVIERNVNNEGFMPFKVNASKTVTANTTLTAGDAGLIVINSSTAVTITLPSASSCPGALFAIRSSNAVAHVIQVATGDTGKITVAYTATGSNDSNAGSTLTLANVVGAAVVLLSDGVNFHAVSWREALTLS